MNTSLLRRAVAAPVLPANAGTRTLVDAAGEELSLRAAAASEAGTFEGYAVLWDVVDSYGTTFARGSFGAGGLDTDPYALLRMHDPLAAIGVFTAREDERGLYITGGWDDDAEGQAARAKARSGSMPELSVGFVPLMVDPDDENRFTQVRLVEVSQITRRMASVPGAAFASARGALLDDGKAARVAEARREQELAVARLRLAGR